MAESYYVYILRCRTGHLYTGYTGNVERRLAEHRRGTASRFTRSRLPVALLYRERFRSRAEAMRKEVAIKRMSRAEKIELCKRAAMRTVSQMSKGTRMTGATSKI